MTTSPSCNTCPSLVPVEDQQRIFGKSVGTAMCGRFNKPLGRPGLPVASEKKLRENMAGKCPEYGKTNGVVDRNAPIKVALPMPSLRREDEDRSDLGSCVSCRNLVLPTDVASETGWPMPMCRTYGKLIPPRASGKIASTCPEAVFGRGEYTMGDITLFPEYDTAFGAEADPTKAYFKKKRDGLVDPSEYETDEEVSDEDAARGIRAWRRILDPEGTGYSVLLPIYRREIFDDGELGKIPATGDDEHPELYVDHNGALYKVGVLWMELDETPALWGMAGVGKTELYRHLAWLMQLPFERVSITASTELDDLAGKMHYSPERGTFFEYGRIPRAWGKPSIICLDEPNTGQPDVWQFIRPLTDNSKQLVLDMNNGEAVSRHKECFMGMAMNPAWDVRNIGAATIGDADGSRLMHIEMSLPPEALEKEIIRNRVRLDGWDITDAQVDMVMRIATEIRLACDEGTLPITWGIRPQLKVARALKWFAPMMAYRLASGDYMEPQARESLLDIVKSHVA